MSMTMPKLSQTMLQNVFMIRRDRQSNTQFQLNNVSGTLPGSMPAVTVLQFRFAPWMLGISTLLAYSYFFQGFGWNQNSHFATIRCIAEHGSPEITPLAGFTGDVSYAGNRIFSNKPPGLALIGTPFYFVMYHVERQFGLDVNDPRIVGYSQHLLSFVLCA